jgi:riboflavin kinase/FMN adenylyltransferase
VHLGHRHLIRECVKEAALSGTASAIFTFFSENRGLKGGVPRLYTTEEKLSIIEEMGVDYAIVADFSSLSDLSAEDFVKSVLIDDLNTVTALSGEEFRFGSKRAGDPSLLSRLLESYGRRAITVNNVKYGGKTVSSTEIRAALSDGRTEYAAKLLCSPYFKRGEVKRGLGIGHLHGFPTINTELSPDSPLKSGVYHTEVLVDGATYGALTNVGVCPTFGEREKHAETMLIGFSGDLYGKTVDVRFLRYLREETRYSSAEELAEQIKKDMEAIK